VEDKSLCSRRGVPKQVGKLLLDAAETVARPLFRLSASLTLFEKSECLRACPPIKEGRIHLIHHIILVYYISQSVWPRFYPSYSPHHLFGMSSPFKTDVTALFASLRSLTEQSAFVATLDNVLDMEERLAELRLDRKLFAREAQEAELEIQRLKEEVGQQQDEIASLKTGLKGTESEISRLTAQLENEKKESQDAFRNVTAELDTKTRRLGELESYMSKLRPTSSSNV
jgi:hypothetical protein